jgi:hypothetical protein
MASQFSCFAPSGIRFTRRKPHAQVIYETLREQWGSLFTDDPTAAVNVETFAQAKCLAIAREQLERAANQANPRHCTSLLSKREADYKLIPDPGATVAERQGELVAARAIRGGARIDALTDGLRAILGDGLLGVTMRDMDEFADGGVYPPSASPQTLNVGAFKALGEPYKVVRLIGHTMDGTVGYEYVTGDRDPLAVGETVTINPGGIGRTETFTVTAVSDVTLQPEGNPPYVGATFSAVFLKSHEAGDICTTAATPIWISGRRFVFVVVTDAVLASTNLKLRANRFLAKALTHASQWALVSSSGAGTAGPFNLFTSILGQTPIEQVTY